MTDTGPHAAATERRTPSNAPAPGRHLIVWDGDCGFCRDCVEWALAHDRRGVLAEIPYQEAPSPPMTPALREACRRAVHVVTSDGRMLRAGRACLFVLGELGWRRTAAILRLPPLVWIVEAGYALAAANRGLASRLLRGRLRRGAAPAACSADETRSAAPQHRH